MAYVKEWLLENVVRPVAVFVAYMYYKAIGKI